MSEPWGQRPQDKPTTKVVQDDVRCHPEQACLYCHVPVGGSHKWECVTQTRKVRVNYKFEVEIEVPVSWGKREIEFHRNEGSWCSSNAIDEINRIVDRDGCPCHICEAEYLGEVEDE